MSFDTILIANRGEIACRVIETARRMGLRTVAVHSDPDARARHVAMADQAVSLGGTSPAESYLDMGKIIAAMQATGAGAVHPGYGFLSENADFVDAVAAAGLVFIGPSADAIRAMGLKDRAKALMEQAGVPVVPGYLGENQDAGHLATEAARIGYPVLIKAVAGGGGKGMRVVERESDFADALASARAEAKTAFGNADVLIEKLIANPRHVEVQIFGDGTRAVHLFERDCSLQRRHQKVVEEAPAPGMTAEVRAAMGAAAVRAAEAVGYAGAGTVEFIADGSSGLRKDGFWFMEMNTRLQVEHPVTEAITGVDLVEWQIRVARGEPLPATQDDLAIDGHAVEVRLYAEDPATGFLPQIGRLDVLDFPPDARIDTGVRAGDAVTPHYDPMIAKITVHAADRTAAFAAMDRALAQTRIAGVATNIDFLARLVADGDVRAGAVDTGLIARRGEALIAVPPMSDAALARAAVAALGPLPDDRPSFTLWSPLRHTVRLGETTFGVTFEGRTARVDWDGGAETVDLSRDPDAYAGDGYVRVFGPGGGRIARPDPLARHASAAGPGTVEAPMPGRITRVLVAEGETVEEGQRLVVMEAMKMEHALRAPSAGQVADLAVAEGDQVVAGHPCLRIEIE
jgi:3-methylcrotonyl-CoA carboxylase alpha subunit